MKPKSRVVLDTNILISAVLVPKSTPGNVLRFVLRNMLPVISSDTFRELNTKLLLPKFDRYASASARKDFLERFLLLSELVPVESVITDCRDPKDNKFLELAVDAQVDYLVSGDKDLLVLDPFRGIPVLSAQDFLVVAQAENA